MITAAGQVVKGYTSPVAAGQSITPVIQTHETIANSGFGAFRWSADSGSSNIRFAKSRGASIGTNAVVVSGDTLGIVSFDGDDGAAFIPAASITSSIDGTPGTNDMPGRLVFNTTADGASTPTERVRINSTGNVLIGTTTNTNSSLLVVNGEISETVGGVQYEVVSQADIGSAPNKIPLNQYLGELAYMNSDQVVINPVASATPVGIGDMVFQLTNNTTLVVKVKGSDGTVRSTTLTLA